MANIANTDKNTSWEDSWRKYDTHIIAQDIPFDLSADEKLKMILDLMQQRIKFSTDNGFKTDLVPKFADFQDVAKSVIDEMLKLTPEEKSVIPVVTSCSFGDTMSLRNRLRRLYVSLNNIDNITVAVTHTVFEFSTYHNKPEWKDFFKVVTSPFLDGIYIPGYTPLIPIDKLVILRRVVSNYICKHKADNEFSYRGANNAECILEQLDNVFTHAADPALHVSAELRHKVMTFLERNYPLSDAIHGIAGILSSIVISEKQSEAFSYAVTFLRTVGMDVDTPKIDEMITKPVPDIVKQRQSDPVSEKEPDDFFSTEVISFGRATDYPTSDEIADENFQHSEIGKMIKPVRRASKNILKYMDSIFLGENDNNDYAIKTEYYRLKALAENTSSELRKLYDALHDAKARKEFVPMEEILWCLKHFCHIGNSEMLRKEAESVDHALLMHTAFESLAKEFYCFRCIAQDTRSGFFDKRYGEILFNQLGTGVTVHKK